MRFQIKNLLHVLVVLFGLLPVVCSCSDDDNDTKDEYSDWQSRNDEYFASVRSQAIKAIAIAKAQDPVSWADKSHWLAFRSYSLSASHVGGTLKDSVYVEVLHRGEGSGSPMSTDSVRVFYAGRLMPSESYADGLMFDHSGQSSIMANIFDHKKNTPATFRVSSCVRGFATALQYMHIGDKWRIYVPYTLGYNNSVQGKVPAYSTLVFDVELVQYARIGSRLPIW